MKKKISIKKKCSKCKENKSLDEFGIKKHNKDGLNHYCKLCENDRSKTRYSNPEEKERRKYYQIFKLYGLTKEEYLEKLNGQHNKCAICDEKLFNDKNTHVDHCHKTGKVRDIICGKCNLILGEVNDNANKLRKLICYINKHE